MSSEDHCADLEGGGRDGDHFVGLVRGVDWRGGGRVVWVICVVVVERKGRMAMESEGSQVE